MPIFRQRDTAVTTYIFLRIYMKIATENQKMS